MHLGKPHRFYRGFNNLRYSWVSREALAVSAFFGLLGAYALAGGFPALLSWLDAPLAMLLTKLLGWGGVAAGLASVFAMSRAYRIKARPFWDHWHTLAGFAASALILGSLFLGLVFGIAGYAAGNPVSGLFVWLAWPLLIGCGIQAAALAAHLRYLKARGAEAAVSRMMMLTDFGKTYRARHGSLGILALAAAGFMVAGVDGVTALLIWGAVSVLAILHELVGRAMFYVLVVPTTMPGDFFWRNQGFEAHARETGLARMPQLGVLADGHG
jgi:DMSO reductase anchor subunit